MSRSVQKKATWIVKESAIHGRGLFAKQDFKAGETVVKAAKRMGGQDGLDRYEITFATRYTNHSSTPNARLKKVASGRVEIIAEQPIKAGAEVLVDYHRTQSALGPGSYMTYRGKVRATRDQLEKQAEEGLKFVEKTIELPAADKLRDAHPGSDADADRWLRRASRRYAEKYPPAKRQRVSGRHRALLESISRRQAAERGQPGQRTWAEEREFLGERLDPVRDWWQENNQPRWMRPRHPYGNDRHLPPEDTRPLDPNSPRERFRRVVIPLLRPAQNTFDKVEDYLRGPQPPGMTPGSRGLAPPTEKESQAMPQPQQQPAPQPQQPGQEQQQPGFVPGSIAAQAAVTPEQQAHVSPEAIAAAQQQGQQPAQPGTPVQPQQPPQAIQQAKQGASLFLDRIKRATGPELAPSPLTDEAKNQMNVVSPQPDPIMTQQHMKPPVPQLGGQMPIATPSSTSFGISPMSAGVPPMPKLAADHNQWLSKNAVDTSTALLAGGALLGTAAGIPVAINKWKESRKEDAKLEKAVERNLRERRARRVAAERWEEEKKEEEEEKQASNLEFADEEELAASWVRLHLAKSAQERTYASPQEYFKLRGNRRLRPPGAPHLRTFSDFIKDILTGGLHGREKARARKLKQQELRDKTRRMLFPRPAKPPRPVAPPDPNFRIAGEADGVGKSAASSYNRVKTSWDDHEKTARKTPAPWWVPAPGKKKPAKRRRKGAPRTTTRTKIKRDGKKGESMITTRSRPGKKVKKSNK